MSILLDNGLVRAEILDPAERDDVHFSSRYSYCGYIKQLYADGKPMLSSPRAVFDSFSGEGFPDEFEEPLGYAEARPGEPFLKIGVGREIRRGGEGYTNRDRHAVAGVAEICLSKGDHFAEFTVGDALGDHAYKYVKRVSLEGENLVVSHILENTGRAELHTLWYSHAFLPVGKSAPRLCVARECELVGGGVYARPEENSAGKAEYRIVLGETGEKGGCCLFRTERAPCVQELFCGVYYRAEGDRPAQELQVFANEKIISAEPKLKINLAAGEKQEWSFRYIFKSTERE